MYEITVENAQEQSSKVLQDAKAVSSAITDQKTYKEAAEYLIKLRTIRKKWKEVINPVKSQAYKAWQQACETERSVDAPFSQAEEVIIQGLGQFADKFEQNKQELSETGMILPDLEAAKGIYNVETWFSEVVNLIDLIKAVAEGQQPLIALEPNMKFLNQQAKSLRDEFNIPGCISVKKTDYRVRTVS